MNIKKPQIKSLTKNIPFIISGCAFAALLSISMKSLFFNAIMAILLIIAASFLSNVFSFWKSHISAFSILLTFCVLGAAVYRFYSSMIYSIRVQTVAELIGIRQSVLVLCTAIVGGIAAFYFVNVITNLSLNTIDLVNANWDLSKGSNSPLQNSINKRQLLFIAATAIVTITICSKSSPIYPFNDWVDANCFLTVGKSMLHGKVPYRDLYEQKGPFLYMLHALAALISETSFLGIYFLELIACGAFLFWGFKTIQLYQKSASVLLVPVLAAVIYSVSCFCHGGSAEELCLPIFAYAIYVGLKSFQYGKSPSYIECFLIGLTSACVLWIKFNLLGFYLGWFCVLSIGLIRRGKTKKLLKIVFFIAFGVLVTSLPILIYFGANHALGDLWTVYFYNNLFAYSNMSENGVFSTLTNNLLTGIKKTYSTNKLPLVITLFGGLTLLRRKGKNDFCFILITFMGTFLPVYIGGRSFKYYCFIFNAFVPIGVAAAAEFIRNFNIEYLHLHIPNAIYRCRSILVSILCVIFLFSMCENTYLLQYKKSDMPQYQFAEIIGQVEDATLLNYGFLDGGFYTAAGIIPNCRYFCKLNIELDEIMETQDRYVEQCLVDFVVTRNEELESDQYKVVATSTIYFEKETYVYYLYKLIQ